jgi:hypothetical protein
MKGFLSPAAIKILAASRRTLVRSSVETLIPSNRAARSNTAFSSGDNRSLTHEDLFSSPTGVHCTPISGFAFIALQTSRHVVLDVGTIGTTKIPSAINPEERRHIETQSGTPDFNERYANLPDRAAKRAVYRLRKGCQLIA